MDKREFKKLFDKTYMPLCMYALRIIRDTRLADDAVQQAMIAAWQRFNEGFVPENIRAYMYRAVRNEALHLLPDTACVGIDPATVDVTDEIVDTSERDAALWRAIDNLPPRCRDVFLAAKRDGMSYVEIAGCMGISIKTVEAQMTKALSRLRIALQPYVSKRSRPFFLPFL
ncbi:MAG: sigma-70 family RNA polymerase sigma factor [Bacteroides sp.]|nr:sigma-70 family RNA polymerase sigma factor [Bacteroides sp.]